MPGAVPPGYNAVIMKNNASNAVKTAKKAVTKMLPSKSRPGAKSVVEVVNSPGGRSNPRQTAPKRSSAKTNTTAQTINFGPTSAPAVATAAPLSGLPEDQALAANYDPSQLNLTTNSKVNGLAGNIQLPNAQSYATNMANMQYGPQIQATASRIKGLTAALPGALEALNKAFANVDAQRQLQAPITSGQGVANLFGGAQGAAAVAANQAVQANNTTANQIGQGNDEANATATRQADWATRIQLLNNMAVNQGRSDLAGELGQKGAAQKAYFDQGLKTRADMVSQAISNQGAINNQKITAALAGGQLESLGLTNQGKALQNSLTGTAAAYAPAQAALGLQATKQQIVTSALNNQINKATATEQLKQLTNPTTNKGVTSMSQAFAAGGGNAIVGMIVPPGAVVADATTGQPKIFGDLNTYANNGVKNIMAQLPDSDPKKVKRYVANYLHGVASASNQWVYKGGRWKRVAQPAAK